MTSHTDHITRRVFLKRSALVAGALNLAPAGVLSRNSQPGANGRFVVAHIGVGGMGMTHLANMLRFHKEGKVRVAAVCDADDNRLEAAVENAKTGGASAIAYRDYRYYAVRRIGYILLDNP